MSMSSSPQTIDRSYFSLACKAGKDCKSLGTLKTPLHGLAGNTELAGTKDQTYPMETPFSWCASRNKPAMRPSKVWSASCISFQKWPPIQIWAKVCTGSAMHVSNVFLADCTDILWHVYENHRSVLIVITRQECPHNVENWQPYLYASRDHSCHASSVPDLRANLDYSASIFADFMNSIHLV
jgi:hypothetical protein